MSVQLPPFVGKRRVRIVNAEPLANVCLSVGFLLVMAYVVPAMIGGR